MDKQFLEAFAEELKAQLITGNAVSIPGLGQFAITHKKQNQAMDKNGRVVLEPPADVITFSPENKTT